MDAPVEEDDDSRAAIRRVEGGIVEIQIEAGRKGCGNLVRRWSGEVLALSLDPDDHAGESGPRDIGAVLEEAAPDPGGALPHLKVGDADRRTRLWVPPLRRRELRVLNRLADFAAELVRRRQELARDEP